MVKPKHYALLTLLAAVLITVLPAGVFVLMGRSPFLNEKPANHRSSPQFVNHKGKSPTVKTSSGPAQSRPRSITKSSRADSGSATGIVQKQDIAASPAIGSGFASPPTASAANSAAGNRDESADPATVAKATATEPNESTGRDRSLYAGGYWGNDELDLTGRIASSESRTTKPAAADPVPTPTNTEPSEFTAPGMVTHVPVDVAEATGHMIDSPVTAGTMPTKSQYPVPKDTKPSASERRRNRSRKPAVEPSTTMPSPQPKTADDGSPIVDILLQSPLESQRVHRVENVVATTNESGWPIALIRSDLPDSRWWVQQITAIRGNAFSARVNFGNTESLSGGKYRLVFVFLETQDEVTRFRIAKQFKEIPNGVRRSREYKFILR